MSLGIASLRRVARRVGVAVTLMGLFSGLALAQQPATPPESFVVYFDFASAKLSALARPVIADAAVAIRRGREQKSLSHVKVIGYSDTAGTVESADRISRQRAEAVRAELLREGIAADFITTEGRGKQDPAVPTADHVRNPRNRRVRIMLYRPGD
jgi:outer membrane protein OmpA-like peptidoglycan-associated protein